MNRRAIFFVSTLIFMSALAPRAAHAQEMEAIEEDSGPSLTVLLKQDTFFGFQGLAQVGVGLTDCLDLTFYTIMWTNPGLGDGAGFNLWTEFGGGVNWEPIEGLSINPQIGILNGVLLSESDQPLAAEGIVPNITATYGNDMGIEANFYLGYYIALRHNDFAGDQRSNFLHYWANAGFAVLPWLSLGVHWEHLIQTTGPASTDSDRERLDENVDVYAWIGPYIEAKAAFGFMRFSVGADIARGSAGDFYQITVGTSL
ncbi:MAG: DUF6733 family protein [Myxococcota bacterium]